MVCHNRPSESASMILNKTIKNELNALSSQYELYWAGGPVRDLLLSRPVIDIDLVLPSDAVAVARKFSEAIKGTLVVLDESHGVARVVSGNCYLDFSEFRNGATSIEEDLQKRDITINAMALPAGTALKLYELWQNGKNDKDLHVPDLIDPCNGLEDVKSRIVRAISKENLLDDPLRLVRIFRFAAELDFLVAPETAAVIRNIAPSISSSAPERVNAELTRILQTKRSGPTFKYMEKASLLKEILPEITGLEGVEQPGFHHLDVLEHCFETLIFMDILIDDPASAFPTPKQFTAWIKKHPGLIPALKWTALMHDWGKPAQKGEKNGRVTFYNHDRTGADMARKVAARLRWSKEERDFTARMIELHMRPFHLLPNFRSGGPTRRALRRLLESTGPHYPALFLQAMADSKAGCGPLKPPKLDNELAGLAERVHEFYLKQLQPAQKAPKLLDGNDIMRLLNLEPGPIVGKIMKAVEAARIEGEISNKKQAEKLARKIFKELKSSS